MGKKLSKISIILTTIRALMYLKHFARWSSRKYASRQKLRVWFYAYV